MSSNLWEASLTGDLVCGHCGHVTIVHDKQKLIQGVLACYQCRHSLELKLEIIDLAEKRAMAAYPGGRPQEGGPKWKGENLYEG
jgi:hypothetical protein